MSEEENGNYTSFVDRYFKRGFRANLPKCGTFEQCCESSNLNDIQILRHSNRICLITLAPTHPIISQNKKISSVSFKVSEKLDRSDNKVSGKRKRGGQWVDETSILCKITCHDDDTTYSIHCGVRGTLVEMNENLITNPELMTSLTQPEHGYVAIVMPKIEEADRMMASLMDEKQFAEYKKRVEAQPSVTNVE